MFGGIADVGGTTAKFVNFMIDRIDVGTGVTLWGTSDGFITDVLTTDVDTSGNQWGLVREDNEVVYTKAKWNFGNAASGAYLSDGGKVLVFEAPTYDTGGATDSDVSTIPDSFYDIYANGISGDYLKLGTKVGDGDTAVGANGLLIKSAGPLVSVRLDGHAFSGGTGDIGIKIYGTTFENMGDVALDSTTGTTDEYIGCTFINCNTVEPGGVQLRNTFFQGYTGTGASLEWNESIDIVNCKFLSNTHPVTDPSAIHHWTNTGSPYTYDGLDFIGNDYDVLNTSIPTGLTINLTASNASTFNPDFGAVTFLTASTLTVTVKDSGGTVIENAVVRIEQTDGTLITQGLTNGSGIYTDSYTGTNQSVVLRVRKSSTGSTRYFPVKASAEIDDGLAVTVTMTTDNIASA
jgi:hypothetical protein